MGVNRVWVVDEEPLECGNRLVVVPRLMISATQSQYILRWIVGVEAHRLLGHCDGFLCSPREAQNPRQPLIAIGVIGIKSDRPFSRGNGLFGLVFNLVKLA